MLSAASIPAFHRAAPKWTCHSSSPRAPQAVLHQLFDFRGTHPKWREELPRGGNLTDYGLVASPELPCPVLDMCVAHSLDFGGRHMIGTQKPSDFGRQFGRLC